MKYGLTLFFASLLILSIDSCGKKKKNEGEKFFPVLSFIQSQVAHVDTSLYFIRKIVYIDSLKSDTIYLNREVFRQEAHDFLNMPDIASSKYSGRYAEVKDFDETISRVWITYTPVKPDKEEIQSEQVLIKPDPSGDKVSNIIINSIINTKDSLIEKRMLWQVDQSFQVTTTRQLKGQPETVSTYKVIWGEDEYR